MTTLSARALTVLLDGWRSSSGPAYAALADRIRLLILDGRIVLGARLPAERDLAGQLGVSRTLVSSAYAELREGGFLHSVRGSGSVARMPHGAAAPLEIQYNDYLDFSKATLPPTPALLDAATWAAEQLPAYLGHSGFDPIGLPVLRQAIADRYTARGLPTDVDQVMVTIGAQHAIGLLSRTLLSRGDRALVESPSYPHAYEALRGAGARLVPVAVTNDQGWDEGMLEQAIQRTSPALGYLMPDFHNPTGRSMDAEQRAWVLDLAARHGTVLVADETMAELSIDDPSPTLPFAAHASMVETAVTVGSVGKTVWGGVRVGWIRADRNLIQRLVRARFANDLGTPILEQLIVTRLLTDYDAILDQRRELLRAGRAHLERRLAERFPQWDVPHPAGGLTMWVGLGAPVSSQLVLAARDEGLVLAAGPRFGVDGLFERFLRIPFSHSAQETDRAVDLLAGAWRRVALAPVAEQPNSPEFMLV